MSGRMGALRADDGGARWYVWAIIVVVAVLLVGFLAARKADSSFMVGTVESVNGNVAVVRVAELNRSFTTESVDPNLRAGTTVVVQVHGDEATLEATSPGMVKLMIALKKLVP